MGKRSRSVRRKTTPVETGAGRMRMFTGTPEGRPTPETPTGRCTVVSNRTINHAHSVQRKTTPVETGAGRMRMFTGTPEWRPTPETPTGRCTVVSNRKVNLRHL